MANRRFGPIKFLATFILVMALAMILAASRELRAGVLFLIIPILVCLISRLSFQMIAIKTGAVFYPTPEISIKSMVELAAPSPGETWVDLGSGDGSVLIAAARAGARAVGYDIDPFMVMRSWWRMRGLGLKPHPVVRWRYLWSVDLSRTRIVSIFSMPKHMGRLEKKFASELKSGCRVVSYLFPLPNWKPERVLNGVYLYRVS